MNPQESKTVFIEYSTASKGQHFMTVVQTIDHKRQIIGRIYRQYDKEKNMTYVATDWEGNSIFRDVHDLPTLKKKFIENGKHLAISIPKVLNEKFSKRPFYEKTERQQQLRKTREAKTRKPAIENQKEPNEKDVSTNNEMKHEKQVSSSETHERDQQLRQIRGSEPKPEIEKEPKENELSETSERDRDLQQIRDQDTDNDKEQDQEVELDI